MRHAYRLLCVLSCPIEVFAFGGAPLHASLAHVALLCKELEQAQRLSVSFTGLDMTLEHRGSSPCLPARCVDRQSVRCPWIVEVGSRKCITKVPLKVVGLSRRYHIDAQRRLTNTGTRIRHRRRVSPVECSVRGIFVAAIIIVCLQSLAGILWGATIYR